MKKAFLVLAVLTVLSSPDAATAASVAFEFSPGPFAGTLEASVAFPQQPVLDDPRGYALEVSGFLSTTVSYPCGIGPCPTGPYTVFADIDLIGLGVPVPLGAVRVFGYGHTARASEPYPFTARFDLTPAQAEYFEGDATALVQVIAALGVTEDSFYFRDIYYDQSIVDAQLSLVPAPLPAAGWLMLAGLMPLLGLCKSRRIGPGC